MEHNRDDADNNWDMMVNAIECFTVYAEDMVQDLEQLNTDTMTTFAIRSLIDGKAADVQRIFHGVCVPEQVNLLWE